MSARQQARWTHSLTLMTKIAPYSVYVSMPTNANVVWDEKIKSPQPCVVCTQTHRNKDQQSTQCGPASGTTASAVVVYHSRDNGIADTHSLKLWHNVADWH